MAGIDKFMNMSRHRAVAIIAGINVVMFAVINITMAVDPAVSGSIFALPSSLGTLFSHPWTVATYMFTQWQLLHLVFNMLWLVMWAAVVRASPQRLFSGYLIGGLGGAAGYIIAAASGGNCGLFLTGASAAVCGFIAATAVTDARKTVRLLLFGNVKIAGAAAVLILLCLLGDLDGNAGTLAAHAGGVISGLIFGLILLAVEYRRLRRTVSRRCADDVDAATLDRLLHKVSRSGYKSLTVMERNTLFEITKRLK